MGFFSVINALGNRMHFQTPATLNKHKVIDPTLLNYKLSYKLRAIKAKSSLGFGWKEEESKGKGAQCFCSSDFSIFYMLYSLSSSAWEKRQLQPGLGSLRVYEKQHLGMASRSRAQTDESSQEKWCETIGQGKHLALQWWYSGAPTAPCVGPSWRQGFCISQPLSEGCGKMAAVGYNRRGRWYH